MDDLIDKWQLRSVYSRNNQHSIYKIIVEVQINKCLTCPLNSIAKNSEHQ